MKEELKRHLKEMFRGPLTDRARVVLSDGRELELQGFYSQKISDVTLSNQYKMSGRCSFFEVLKEDALEVRSKAQFFMDDLKTEVASIIDQHDGTVLLELREETLGEPSDGKGIGKLKF